MKRTFETDRSLRRPPVVGTSEELESLKTLYEQKRAEMEQSKADYEQALKKAGNTALENTEVLSVQQSTIADQQAALDALHAQIEVLETRLQTGVEYMNEADGVERADQIADDELAIEESDEENENEQ